MQAVTASRWTAEKRLAPGTYDWGAVYGGSLTWLLDQPLTYGNFETAFAFDHVRAFISAMPPPSMYAYGGTV